MKRKITYLFTMLFLLTFIIPSQAQERQKKYELRSMYQGQKSSSGVLRSLNEQTDIPDVFADREIFGNVVWLREWSNLWEGEIPYGFYSATIGDELYFEKEYSDLGFNFYCGTYAKGKYYGIRPAVIMGILNGIFLYEVDTETWTITKQIIEPDGSFGLLSEAMAYDETSDKIYALQYTNELDGLYWSTFDKETLTYEFINYWSGNFNVLAMAGTPDGSMYCIGADGNFYSMDKTDGQPTLVGATGVSPQLYIQSATYDGKSGTILWSAIVDGGNGLYSINIETGEAAFITGYSQDAQLAGIYILENGAPDAAPAAIADLVVSYTQNGGLDGTIGFTVPSTTYGGSTLSGKVNVTVFVDGMVVSESLVDPSTRFDISHTFTNDNHCIAVAVTNSAGMSPYNTLRTYSGYDFPKAVTDVTYEIDDNGFSQLTWSQPTGGVNDGYLDYDELHYNVYRYPGNVLVGNKLAACSFSEQMPTEMQNYYYKIAAYNGDNKPGVEYITDAINHGEAFVVPYVQTFQNDPIEELFTIIDGNEDGRTWTHASWNYEMNFNTTGVECDDWLITPRIRFEANKKYRLTFAVRGFAVNYVESLRVSLGTDAEDLSTFNETLIDMPEMAIYDFTDIPAEFIISADGDYLIGFYAYSGDESSTIRLTNIRVELIGDIQAPEGVSDLQIVADANDELKATVSFTTPITNLNDDALTSLSKVHVYRGYGDTPVHTFDNPAIGAGLNWTDENVEKVGVTAYRIVGENEFGLGKFMADSTFVGVYAAPYLETFDTPGTKDLYTYISNFDGTVDEEAADWSYNNGAIQDSYWGGLPADNWMFTPAIKLESESVYRLKFDYTGNGALGGYFRIETSFGTLATPEGRTIIEGWDEPGVYSMTPVEHEFITDQAGKYHIGWNLLLSGDIFLYMTFNIDNISIERFTSANAPGAITDLQIVPDPQGKLAADISFKAPLVSYKNGPLSSITRIDIYRNNSGIPVKTFNDVQPGQELDWTDTDARHGNNDYLFIAFNEHGNGRYVEESLFVGYDIPEDIAELTITTSPDNAKATLEWSTPEKGANGGLLNMDALYYKVVEYDAVSQTFTTIDEKVKENTYIIDKSELTIQDYFYYGVVPVSDIGEGNAKLTDVLLGPAYELPFAESFSAEGYPITHPWSAGIDGDNPYAAGWVAAIDSETILSQDGDSGFIGFVNYDYSGVGQGGTMRSPKIATKGMKDINLSFWLYQGPVIADTKDPYIRIDVKVDNDLPEAISEQLFLDEGEGWTEYTINLDNYKTADYIQVYFYAYSAFFYQALYIDNISVEGTQDVKINDIASAIRVYSAKQSLIIEGAEGRKVDIYDINGKAISSFIAKNREQRTLNQGFYAVKVGTEAFKVIIR